MSLPPGLVEGCPKRLWRTPSPRGAEKYSFFGHSSAFFVILPYFNNLIGLLAAFLEVLIWRVPAAYFRVFQMYFRGFSRRVSMGTAVCLGGLCNVFRRTPQRASGLSATTLWSACPGKDASDFTGGCEELSGFLGAVFRGTAASDLWDENWVLAKNSWVP